MLKSELLEIISNGESSGVEFKRDDIRPEQLAKEIVAFANFEGGRILLGVEDDGSVTGIQRENTQEWVLNVFRDKVHPQMIPFYEEIEIEPERKVAIVTIGRGISKPYVVRHNNREDTYIRLGDRSELASREQQLRLFESGGLLHVEVMPVPGSSFSNLDLERIKFYLTEIMEDPDVPNGEEREKWIDRLVGMGFMAEDSQGSKVCSVGGLVCFGIKPRRYLRQAGIRLSVFEGSEKEYAAKLDAVLDGPLVARWQVTDSGEKEIVDDGLIEVFAKQIEPFITVESDVVDEGLRREHQHLYPREAIREVVLNAVAHRDWTKAVDIDVTVYEGRLEVISPGKLQNSMTVKKMVDGQRSPRNPMIMDVLRDYGYVDSRGMGIRKKVIPLMKKVNDTEPVFEATEDYLKTTLLATRGSNPSSEIKQN
ncbi:MAG: putative DNA binding domain-containing protein [Opitutales bacterium]|nr:putative DNA binding domain-containing protein [Opitutales bacterium]